MAAPIDLATLEDDVLDAMRVAILTEQERRQRCAQLPEQLEVMARAAVDAGVPAETVRAALDAGTAGTAVTTTEQEAAS